jgi:MFS family permease
VTEAGQPTEQGTPGTSGVETVTVAPAVAGRSFGPLRLSAGTNRLNISGYYLLALTSIMLFTFIPAAQTALLTNIIGVPEDDQGAVVGTAGLIAEIVLIATVGLAGAWSDRIGRRPIVVAGYTLLGLGVGLTPFVGSTLPFYLARALAGVGIAMITVMITAVITDYVRNETRGKANGFLGLCNGIGALITFFVLVKLPDRFESGGMDEVTALRTTYLIIAGIALLTALAMRLMLRSGQAVVQTDRTPILQLLREGVGAARRPGVSFAYASAFVARADLALVGAFLTLWAQQYGKNELGLNETEALAKAGILLGVANGVALLAAPLIGIIADRLTRTDAVLISLATAAVGYTATIFVDNPFSGLGYAVAAVIGCGQVSAVISSQVLIAEQAPRRTRGSIIGTFALSGGVGIMVAFAVGGVLFDAWRPAGPFIVFGVLAAIAFGYGLSVRRRIVVPAEANLDG